MEQLDKLFKVATKDNIFGHFFSNDFMQATSYFASLKLQAGSLSVSDYMVLLIG